MSNGGLNFVYLMFGRHLIQAFKHSNECFKIFTDFLSDFLNHEPVLNHEPGNNNLKNELELVDKFLLVISQIWDVLYYLNNQEEKIRKFIYDLIETE